MMLGTMPSIEAVDDQAPKRRQKPARGPDGPTPPAATGCCW